ncbi:MAG: minor capsid protein [Bacteroidales bacterium]|nr:minor capsid protein [Bacteroidales bacterium]
MVYNAGGFDPSQLNTPEARRLIAETLQQLNTAISSGVPHEVPEVVRYALENNAFIFSGFKAFHTLREVGLSLTTDKGEIKPFETFLKDVEQVNNRYNHNYLYAEYNHAVGASLMAARWQQIEADGDRYDLQYRTAQDDRVREDHAILHGTTLPPSDPFWAQYLPPNGWNCRCTAVQVRKGKYPQSDPALSMLRGQNCTEAAKQQIFRFNPGKELKLFPPKHPYYKAPEAAKKELFHIAKREAQNNAAPIVLEMDNLQTGKLNQTRKAMQRAYGHAFNQEELSMYDYIIANIDKLVFKAFSPFGEGKDLTNPKHEKNLKKKRERGVTGYNVYSIIISGIEWQVKTEIYKNRTEAVYHIMKKK